MSSYANERHGGGRDSLYEDNSRTARRSPAHKKRAVAADYFDDNDNTHYRKHSEHRRHHHHRDADGQEGHKRRKKHHHRRHHHSSSRHDQNVAPVPAELPFKARLLSYKHDVDVFEPLFANYLDIQKSMDFYGLDAHEQKGRWKSFVNKWNRGELAEGWYDPEMFERLAKEAPERPASGPREAPLAQRAYGDPEVESQDDAQEPPPRPDEQRSDNDDAGSNDNDDDDDDDYGPPPPPGTTTPTPSLSRKGPGIPSLSDLALQREAAAEARAAATADLRLARKADREQQKEALDELVPRAEPGTRERKLEKKAAVNEKMRSFREKGDAAGVEEVDDGELLGGGNGVEEFKRAVASQQRKKTERELRREQEARARWEEREEKMKDWRAREEEKMKSLKELAKARFG